MDDLRVDPGTAAIPGLLHERGRGEHSGPAEGHPATDLLPHHQEPQPQGTHQRIYADPG